ncbi:hypothetical protein OG417_18145 [Actinoallomurus sp. NBC_01490]|nr:hypothetical protein [Actinoallomurus sp. NBC_01490]
MAPIGLAWAVRSRARALEDEANVAAGRTLHTPRDRRPVGVGEGGWWGRR